MQLKQKEIDYNSIEHENKKILLNEINNHLLLDDKPSDFFNAILTTPVFQEHPFSMLYRMVETEQSPIHHPEGNVWNHTMLVVDKAAELKQKSKNDKIFMWAALLHDIGKPDTTRNRKGKITAYEHEIAGASLSKEFLREFTKDNAFIEHVSMLIRWHMQILHVVKDMGFADIKIMKEQTDYKEVALLGYCDRLGRTKVDIKKEEENISIFLKKCRLN